jgi:hypothetical protein
VGWLAWGGSARDEKFAKPLHPPNHGRLARSGGDCLVGQLEQLSGMEARSQAFEPLSGDGPVAIAAGAPEQIEVAVEAFAECRAQLGEQRRIVSRRRRQRRFE